MDRKRAERNCPDKQPAQIGLCQVCRWAQDHPDEHQVGGIRKENRGGDQQGRVVRVTSAHISVGPH